MLKKVAEFMIMIYIIAKNTKNSTRFLALPRCATSVSCLPIHTPFVSYLSSHIVLSHIVLFENLTGKDFLKKELREGKRMAEMNKAKERISIFVTIDIPCRFLS